MPLQALFVGGCPYSFHRIEPTEAPIRAALEPLDIEVTFDGIFHPDGGEAFTGDYSSLTTESLSQYDLVVLYTTGNDRRGADIEAIRNFVGAGKALVGIHNATDTFTDDPAFVSMMGGRFRTHPAQLSIQTEIVDSTHPITEGLEGFTVWDELYLFADYDPENVHLLAQTQSYAEEESVPIAWTREEGAGRIFYLSLGHTPSTLEDGNWRQFFQNGVEWALRRR